jgi:hypothetical protein
MAAEPLVLACIFRADGQQKATQPVLDCAIVTVTCARPAHGERYDRTPRTGFRPRVIIVPIRGEAVATAKNSDEALANYSFRRAIRLQVITEDVMRFLFIESR